MNLVTDQDFLSRPFCMESGPVLGTKIDLNYSILFSFCISLSKFPCKTLACDQFFFKVNFETKRKDGIFNVEERWFVNQSLQRELKDKVT